MLRPYSKLLLVLSLVLALVYPACGILVGRLRRKEEPASNVVPGSAVRFPTFDEEDCKTDHGYLGRCVDIRMCHAARRAIASRNHPVRCGWINNYIPRVCCHPEQVQFTKMIFRPSRSWRRNRHARMT